MTELIATGSPDALLIDSLIVILASVGAIALLTRVGLPAAVGYLLAGLVIGSHGLQSLAASDETKFLAELGIIFLMFMVGLEFSLPTMIRAHTRVRRWQPAGWPHVSNRDGERHALGCKLASRHSPGRCRGDVINRDRAQAVGRPG
jgi:hypothetical protein